MPLTQEQQLAELKKLVDLVRPEIEPLVKRIEAGPMTTQDHYGDYLQVISVFPQDHQKFIVVALLHCGANRNGVASAAMVMGLM